jgi:hypothetical protein
MQSGRIIAVSLTALMICALCFGLASMLRSGLSRPKPRTYARVVVFDPRLTIFAAAKFYGTNTFYLAKTEPWTVATSVSGSPSSELTYSLIAPGYHVGRRVEGFLRERLRSWGWPVKPFPSFTPGRETNACAFILDYAFPLAGPDAHLEAEVVYGDGKTVGLWCSMMGRGGAPSSCWDLLLTPDSAPSLDGTNWVLRLKCQTNGPPVGEIRFEQGRKRAPRRFTT